jgi:anti-sigma factor RsiW
MGKPGGEKMLTCSEAEKLLDLYLDQELDPPTKEKCEQHLRHCSRCSELLKLREQERETIINGFPVPELTPAFSKQIMEKITNPALNRTPSKSPWRKNWMLPLTAACLLVLVIYGAFSQGIFSSPQDAMLTDQNLEQSREIANVTEGNSSASPQKDVKEGTVTAEPALPPDAIAPDERAVNNRSDLDTGVSSGQITPITPATAVFTPQYLPPGFVMCSASSSGYEGKGGSPAISILSFENPQTGGRLCLEIIPDNTGAEMNAQDTPAAAGSQDIMLYQLATRYVEKNGQHYWVRICGDVPQTELNKVLDSLK